MKRTLLALWALGSVAMAGTASPAITTLQGSLPEGRSAMQATFPNTLNVSAIQVESRNCPAVSAIQVGDKTVTEGTLDEVTRSKQIQVQWEKPAAKACEFTLKVVPDDYRDYQFAAAAAPAAPGINYIVYPQPIYQYQVYTYPVYTYPVYAYPVYTPVYTYPVYTYPVVTNPVVIIWH